MRGSSHETLVRCAGSLEQEQPGDTSTFDRRVEIFSLCASNLHEKASLMRHSQSLCWFSTTRNDFFSPKLIKKVGLHTK